MSPLTQALLYSLIAGGAIPLGGLIASVERIRPRWLEEEFRHGVIAFGGGALLAAVGLVLVPEGGRRLTPYWAVIWFTLGGVAFYFLDGFLAKRQGVGVQLVAMLSDFLPEAVALGASLAAGERTGPLLAFLIALQNVPEAFNAYREMRSGGNRSPRMILMAFAALSLLGPLAAGIGMTVFADRPAWLGGLMLFAGGGILYLTFEDIAPQAQLKWARLPALGAVLGFALGIIGFLLTAG